MLTGLPSKKGNYIFFFSFLILYILSVVINWSVLPLGGEEPRRALISIEMLHSGNYILPTVFGWEYFNKPVVYNWVLCFLIAITGSTKEWLVRLPSLIFLLLWAFCHYQFTKKFFSKNIAILSALFLLTDFDLFFYALGSGGEIDVFYSFLVYLQIMFLFYFNQKQQWLKLFIYSYLFCALGFLTKGFPSILFQVFSLAALCAFNRSAKVFFRWQHLVGLLVFSFLVGVYLYVYSFYSSPLRLVINLLNESFQKSAVGERSERLWSKVFIYPFSFLKLLLPWSMLFLLLLKKHSYRLVEHPLVRFSILFILFNLWLYAFTGRPILRYVYSFIPFSYNIAAYIFWKTSDENPALIKTIFKYAGYLFIMVLMALFVLPFFVTASVFWVCLLSVILFAFIVAYRRNLLNQVWTFCVGLVLFRMIYAAVFIPIQHRLIKVDYREVADDITRSNNRGDIVFWTPPEPLEVGLDLKFWKWKYESVITPPRLTNYMIPYYYFYHTGHLMKYDTTLRSNQTFLTSRERIKNKNVIIFWNWYDVRQKIDFVLFRMK